MRDETSVPGEARDRFPAGRGGGGTGGGPRGVGAAAGRTGRPPKTSRGELLAAARAHGFVDLTVQVMTDAVGVKYSTFYRHFKSFDELLAVLVDDALQHADGPLPDPATDWRAHLACTATTLRQTAVLHPGLARALAELADRPALLVAVRERAISMLTEAGAELSVAEDAVDGVLALATGDPDRTNAHAVALIIDGVGSRLAGVVVRSGAEQ